MPGDFSANLNLKPQNRSDLIDVIFKVDPMMIDYIARTFYDSHVDRIEEIIKPNPEVYRCPVCNKEYNSNNYREYYICRGGDSVPTHEPTSTEPVGWKPLLTKEGFNMVLAWLEAVLSPNLSTGNYGDVGAQSSVHAYKNDDKMNDVLVKESISKATHLVYTLIENPYEYVNPVYFTNGAKLSSKFSFSFDVGVMSTLKSHIYSVVSKGREMAALRTITENKVILEQNSQHGMDYTSQGNDGNKGGSTDFFSRIFSKAHGL